MQNDTILLTEVLNRLKTTFNLEKDADIARLLEVDPAKLGVWKSRNYIPLEHIVVLCNKNGLTINWVLYGKGLKKLAITERTPLTMEEEMEKIEIQRDLLKIMVEKMNLLQKKADDDKLKKEISTLKRVSELIDRF